MHIQAPRSLISGKVAFDFTAYLLSFEFWWGNRVMNYVRPVNSIYWWHPIGGELVFLL
jgi:hypothetical protein